MFNLSPSFIDFILLRVEQILHVIYHSIQQIWFNINKTDLKDTIVDFYFW